MVKFSQSSNFLNEIVIGEFQENAIKRSISRMQKYKQAPKAHPNTQSRQKNDA